jgi:streptomycin 6-kinase
MRRMIGRRLGREALRLFEELPPEAVRRPAYDAPQHLLSCMRLRSRPAAIIRRFAGLAELDEERVRLWVFARAALGSEELAPVAGALAP